MKRQILIGDDHELIRTGVTNLIRNLGYQEIKAARSCSEIMKFLKENTYTHAILDLELKNESTLEIIPNIRNIYPTLNIAILSMKQPDVYRQAIRPYKIEYFLSKEASNEETVFMLGKFLNN